jgi:glutathione synthase/RimK-type ligase-like ATP-grasp enzyme
VRTPWDYSSRRDAFLAWIGRASAATRLWNPPDVLRWNTHKFHLRELAAAGLPVVPTEFVPAGVRVDLSRWMTRKGWDKLVLKPAVGAGGRGSLQVDRDRAAEGERHLQQIGDALVQPLLPAVVDPGERCLVFLGGEYSHAVRKQPFGQHGSERPITPDEDELAVARAILARSPGPLLYARVDLLRDPRGRPCLLELEVTEPQLYFEFAPAARDRLADLIKSALGASG